MHSLNSGSYTRLVIYSDVFEAVTGSKRAKDGNVKSCFWPAFGRDSSVASNSIPRRASSEALSWHQRTACQSNNFHSPRMALDDYRRNQDNDVRLVDFLDDKLQAFADLETLDSLLDSVKAQQDLLKQQVCEVPIHRVLIHFLTLEVAE